MEGYLGEERINIAESKYKNYTKSDWAMLWIEMYSGIDGEHHKDWLVDQVARILKGAPIVYNLAKWDGGQTEDRFNLDEPAKEYWDWVKHMKAGEDGPETYSYDFGIAP